MNSRIRCLNSIRPILALAALTLALTAGGATVASALTKDQLAGKTNRLCKTFNRQADEAADTGKTTRAIYAKIYKLQSKLVRKLHRFDAPADVKALFDEFVAGTERQRKYLRQARDHADDPAALKRIDKKSRKGAKRAKRVAGKLGAPACAAG